MKIVILDGTDDDLYRYVGPYAMSARHVRQNGNPITTSDKHRWYVEVDDKDRAQGFCSVKMSYNGLRRRIGNLVLPRDAKSFTPLIAQVIREAVEAEAVLTAYVSDDKTEWFRRLGFRMMRQGVNWHVMGYKHDRTRSDDTEA
ncbi:MAG: hypothetical protein LBH06_03985 [Rikenellaceae bacterium]|jgi:hypothetical protein|nr:hypothetical protein [Rikenellaceae bacterium]